ncbi:MAG: hypothetical protein L6V93_15150 [Clostridiales bacterium]|nr:MAG: hypothetical protein L6V93_15150 [Clostridiales bacterium]
MTDGNADITDDGEVFAGGIGKVEITAVKTSDNYSDISSKVIFTAMPKKTSRLILTVSNRHSAVRSAK